MLNGRFDQPMPCVRRPSSLVRVTLRGAMPPKDENARYGYAKATARGNLQSRHALFGAGGLGLSG